jgi:hypothetical protein
VLEMGEERRRGGMRGEVGRGSNGLVEGEEGKDVVWK